MFSLYDTQNPLSLDFQHRLESKMVLQKFIISFTILGVHLTFRETHWNLQNIKDYNFIISVSSDQFQIYSAHSIHALFALTIP